MTEAWARYTPEGKWAEGFAKGKMNGDPAYVEVFGLLDHGATSLLDVGCGEGYLLAIVRHERPSVELFGFDHDPRRLEMARRVFKGEAGLHLSVGDIRVSPLPNSDVITCLDVLHYLDPSEQDMVLNRLANAVNPGGMLLIRDGETGGGWASTLLKCAERFAVWIGRHKGDGVFFRPASETAERLRAAGLEVDVRPCNTGTPFANVLFIAHRAPVT
jgi:SAM-dependent methyltransferase